MAPSLIGIQLGKYQIIELIGQGGMATVYKGYRKDIDRYVAVKVLPPHPGQSDSFVERFQLEARTIARLQHPHILPLYDYGVQDDITYLAMAYVEGGSLSDLIDRGAMSPEQAEPLLRQVASALDYAHRQGVIHRDIKPDNILLDKEGHALLADFGIAKIMEGDTALTGTGALVGTPAYMSPEQCQGIPLMPQSDIYSLGVIAYEMITGQQPFKADTPMQMVLKHLTEPVPHISKVMDGLPQKLEMVMMRVLGKEPEDRYETATAFLQDFTRAIHRDVSLPHLTPIMETVVLAAPPREPVLRRVGQSPLALMVGFLGLMALVIFALTGINRSQQASASEVSALVIGATSNGTNSGSLNFSSTNSLGDTVSLSVENLVPPRTNQNYTVWLWNTHEDTYLNLGGLSLDARGSGLLVYHDAAGRLLLSVYDSALITLEERSGTTGLRVSSPNVRQAQQSAPTRPAGLVIYSAGLPAEITEALGEILAESAQGIEGSGLLDSVFVETLAALENSQLDYRASLGSLRTYAEHSLNILQGTQEDYNGNRVGENPGRGVGLPVLLDAMDTRLAALEARPEAGLRLQGDIGLIRTCLENTRVRVARVVVLQQSALAADNLEAALPLADEADMLVNALIPGVDQNQNGRVEPFAGECGLEQVAALSMLLGSLEMQAHTEG